jgi:YtkA-like
MLQDQDEISCIEANISSERGTISMKRFSLTTVAVIMTLVLAVGTSWGYEAQKTAGGLTITLSAGSYPLVKGDNDLRVKITDAAGKAVTEAKVTARFFMPAMPGMAPMSSKSEPVLKGGSYEFKAGVSMEGTWKTEVTVVLPGKSPVTATFNLDAR